MTAARSFFDGLWETLTGQASICSKHQKRDLDCPLCRQPFNQTPSIGAIHPVGTPHCVLHGYSAGDHRSCVINTGPYCNEPVMQGQIDEGDAHPIDERGVNDGKYEHVWCVQGG